MSLFQAFTLGIVQGITEYLPVSSSAHLVLVPTLFGWHFAEQEVFLFNILVQLGTLVGVVIYFSHDLRLIFGGVLGGIIKRKPLEDPQAVLGWLIVLATIPAGVFGLLFKKELSAFFSSPKAAMGFLLLTACLLITCEFVHRKFHHHVKLPDAVLMGCAQALALFPGVSRSGSTISVGMMGGLKRESAARFSFLMSIPVILGASVVALKDIFDYSEHVSHMILPIIVGFISAAISGYFVIKWFLDFLKSQSLLLFAFYCFVGGGIGLILI